jgi:hypothetical protein
MNRLPPEVSLPMLQSRDFQEKTMDTLALVLPYLQSFFQLNFLFSGMETSSTVILMARLCVFVIFGFGALWIALKITLKFLDCVQTLFTVLAPLPKSFFLILLLVIPLSPDSIASRWIGYILLILALFGVGCTGVFLVVLWKYGVDQAFRLIRFFRSAPHSTETSAAQNRAQPSENVLLATGGFHKTQHEAS